MASLGRLCSALALILSVLCTACISGRAHENFKNAMQRQIGKSADDPNTPITGGYPRDIGAEISLPNGNIEREYRFGPSCTVYFAIDKVSQKIIGWRYEGTEETCVLVP